VAKAIEAWKTGVLARGPWVRIPPLPPDKKHHAVEESGLRDLADMICADPPSWGGVLLPVNPYSTRSSCRAARKFSDPELMPFGKGWG
jgi:hypothetical protein